MRRISKKDKRIRIRIRTEDKDKRIRIRLAFFWVLTLKHLLQGKKFQYLFLIMFSWATELVPLWLSQARMNGIGNLPKYSV